MSNDLTRLKDTFADLAEHAGSADLYDRALAASRRMHRRRLAATALAGVALAAAIAVPLATAVGEASAPAPSKPGSSTPASPGPSASASAAPLAAAAAGAPYYVAIEADGVHAGVYDARTGKQVAWIPVPEATGSGGSAVPIPFAAVAGAADDRTFVLVASDYTADEEPVEVFEVTLDASGKPGNVRPLDYIHLTEGSITHPTDGSYAVMQAIGSAALSPDGTRLAIGVSRVRGNDSAGSDIVVADLRTQQVRTWTDKQHDLGSIAWLDNTRLAYDFEGISVLDTTGPVGSLTAGEQHPLIPSKADGYQMGGLSQFAVSPDGKHIFVNVVSSGDFADSNLALAEFTTTGAFERIVVPPSSFGPADAGQACTVLWGDPADDHLIVDCGWPTRVGTVDGGVFHAVATPLLPDADAGIGGYLPGDQVAW